MVQRHFIVSGITFLTALYHAVNVVSGVVTEADVGLTRFQIVHDLADAPILDVNFVKSLDILNDFA